VIRIKAIGEAKGDKQAFSMHSNAKMLGIYDKTLRESPTNDCSAIPSAYRTSCGRLTENIGREVESADNGFEVRPFHISTFVMAR
jgi:hypothetical protein